MRDLAKGSLLMVGSGLAFGSLTVLTKLAYAEGIAIATLLVLRFGIGASPLLPLALRERAPFGAFARAVALGAVGYGATTLLYFHALVTLPAGVAAFLLYLAPIPVAILARVLFRERLSRPALAGLVLGLVGLAALTLAPGVALDPRGVALALGAAVAYAATVLAGRHLAATASPWVVASGACVGATLTWLAYGAATRGLLLPPTGAAWGYAVLIALLCTSVAMATFYFGLRLVGAARGSVLSMVEPAASVLLAALILGESLLPLQLAGCALVAVGVALTSR